MSPDTGRSSPAIERKVVVLPQPDGPSSVNSLPSGTSNETSCAALTAAPRSLAYSVNNDLTLSTLDPLGSLPLASLSGACPFSENRFPLFRDMRCFLCFRDPEPAADELRQHDQAEQRDDQHDAERGELDVLPILPQLPYHDRHHLGAG